jgi:hypothetical protein
MAVGVFGACFFGLSGSAWADSGTSDPVLPTNLWVAPLAGGVVALVAVLVATALSGSLHASGWRTPVLSASAWDFQDSWVTNLTALGGTLTAVFSATALGSFFHNTNTDGFTVVSLLFGGATIMGPLVYGAFSCKPTSSTSQPTGTRAGAVLASVVTLFAVFGLLANVGQLISYTIATSTEKVLVYVALGGSALVVAIYAVRSIDAMVNQPRSTTPGQVSAPSLLSPVTHVSGTL